MAPHITEFAHIHNRYIPAESDPEGRGRPWQQWQGGGLGSMHLVLHPKDADLLVSEEKKWGERHVLAETRPELVEQGVMPRGLVLVYAPRDEGEIEIVLRVVKASLDYVDILGGGE